MSRNTHCWGLGGPAGRAHLSVSLNKLECLHQAKSLLYTAADWQVIHTHVFHHPIWIDNEQTPAGERWLKRTSRSIFLNSTYRLNT